MALFVVRQIVRDVQHKVWYAERRPADRRYWVQISTTPSPKTNPRMKTTNQSCKEQRWKKIQAGGGGETVSDLMIGTSLQDATARWILGVGSESL